MTQTNTEVVEEFKGTVWHSRLEAFDAETTDEEDKDHPTEMFIGWLLNALTRNDKPTISDFDDKCVELGIPSRTIHSLVSIHTQALQAKDTQAEEMMRAILEHEFTDSWNCQAVYKDTIVRIAKENGIDLNSDKRVCAHGEAENDYCEPCGRIHNN